MQKKIWLVPAHLADAANSVLEKLESAPACSFVSLTANEWAVFEIAKPITVEQTVIPPQEA